jgi:hypothetical protein
MKLHFSLWYIVNWKTYDNSNCLLWNPDAYLCSFTISLSSTVFATVNLYNFVSIFFFLLTDNMLKSLEINLYKINKINKIIKHVITA